MAPQREVRPIQFIPTYVRAAIVAAIALWGLALAPGDTDVPPLTWASDIEVTGNNKKLANGQTAFSDEDGTYFGVAKTDKTHSFTVTNSGSADLGNIEVKLGGRDAERFDLGGTTSGSLAEGASLRFTISYTPEDNEGLHIADVTVGSDEAFTFRVAGIGDTEIAECLTCFGKAADDSNVCSGQGSCIANDKCKCTSRHGGSKCQTHYIFDSGQYEIKSEMEFFGNATIYPGPVLDDPDAVYEIRLKISNAFIDPQTSKGVTFGLCNKPLDAVDHNVGDLEYEYAYLQTGEIVSNGVTQSFGSEIYEGDSIKLVYDAPAKTLNFYLSQKSQPFEKQGTGNAFENVVAKPGKELGFCYSVLCFGLCKVSFES